MHDLARNLARTARVLGDAARLRILDALMEGNASSTDLSRRLGLMPERVTRHLASLRRAGWVTAVEEDGGRLWSVDAERVGPALAALRGLADPGRAEFALSAQAAREVRRNSPLRQARTCYDHLGGVEAVALLEAMVARGWLTPDGPRPVYLLTLEGGQALSERGVELERRAASRRTFAYGCLDWTERRAHLGGALGAAVRRALESSGYLRRVPGTRVLEPVRPIEEWLDAPTVDLNSRALSGSAR